MTNHSYLNACEILHIYTSHMGLERLMFGARNEYCPLENLVFAQAAVGSFLSGNGSACFVSRYMNPGTDGLDIDLFSFDLHPDTALIFRLELGIVP